MKPWIVPLSCCARGGTPQAHRITTVQIQCRRFRRMSRSTKTRSPTAQRIPPAASSHSACQNKHKVSRVSLQAQYQAFVRSCGRKQRSSLKPSRSIGPASWNLSLGAGSRSENSGLHPQHPADVYLVFSGPATLDRCCGRNVVAPGEYSKWFFFLQSGFMAAISAPRPPGRCRPDRLWRAAARLTLPRVIKLQCRRFGPAPPPRPARPRLPAAGPPGESARDRRRARRRRRRARPADRDRALPVARPAISAERI